MPEPTHPPNLESLASRALAVIRARRLELGTDLQGRSVRDLLADTFPGITTRDLDDLIVVAGVEAEDWRRVDDTLPPPAAQVRAFYDPIETNYCLAGCKREISRGYEREIRPGLWAQRVCADCATGRLAWPLDAVDATATDPDDSAALIALDFGAPRC